ncbi:Succinate dehydrogenase assembly factor 2 mitochondrial [Cladophialophora chaetospira]|uniref:Succinate dehydrogenase assembly factor 2, mitochondrial n=1 Tax=Cladophialophora chaetospira TaxID=386627 RepID=A0AA39CEB3_9EURO|nr:Succinate dehydrogenase assembly factor 2 mitochondrial [Cladophialophora chaetospira]
MNASRVLSRRLAAHRLPSSISRRCIASTSSRLASAEENLAQRYHKNVEEHRKYQIEKASNPHMTNTTSTIHNEMPSIGKDSPPPEMISATDSEYTPKDRIPENTDKMTGGTQPGDPDKVSQSDYAVGEMEGISFKVEPLRRFGEDLPTMRARLLYQSRKRGTLESDLLLSTFAAEKLSSMSRAQLQEYDHFLDENDWDIYYWATQTEAGTPTSLEYAEGAINETKTQTTEYKSPASPGQAQETDAWRQGAPRSGEWAQTVGAFKPAFRPVPQRWKDSEVLSLLRKHVKARSAGGVLEQSEAAANTKPTGSGLGRMPDVQTFT